MILEALVKLYESLAAKDEVPQWGWSSVGVSYGLELDESGNLVNVVDLRHEITRKKKSVYVPTEKWVPERQKKSSGITPQFICENSNYFLGIDDKTKPERSLLCFKSAARLHKLILKDCTSATAMAIKGFFDHWCPQEATDSEVLVPYMDSLMTSNLIFMFGGRLATEDSQIRDAWAKYKNNQDSEKMQCLVTGEVAPIARLHPIIKGLRNAQPTGASLISFNQASFESRANSKAQGLNAPVSEYVAFAYATALNYLLAHPKNTKILDDVTVVYWAESQESEPYMDCLDNLIFRSEPDDTLNDVLQNLKQGIPFQYQGIQMDYDTPFYILGISPNVSRISVRFFLQSTFDFLAKNVLRHASDMEIICPSYKTNTLIPLWMILQSTLAAKSDTKVSPLLGGAVTKSILSGDKYPESLYRYVLGRIKSEQDNTDSKPPIFKLTYERCAIIKAYLTRNKGRKITVALDENERDTAYVLGRIFSTLEYTQYKAEGKLNSSIKDKYFNSACATPAQIFPILYKLSTHHIHKLNVKGGKGFYVEKSLTELVSKLETPVPKTLTLEQQGMFILGYYHQTQERFSSIEEAKAK